MYLNFFKLPKIKFFSSFNDRYDYENEFEKNKRSKITLELQPQSNFKPLKRL